MSVRVVVITGVSGAVKVITGVSGAVQVQGTG